jgi:hypothetical protein
VTIYRNLILFIVVAYVSNSLKQSHSPRNSSSMSVSDTHIYPNTNTHYTNTNTASSLSLSLSPLSSDRRESTYANSFMTPNNNHNNNNSSVNNSNSNRQSRRRTDELVCERCNVSLRSLDALRPLPGIIDTLCWEQLKFILSIGYSCIWSIALYTGNGTISYDR